MSSSCSWTNVNNIGLHWNPGIIGLGMGGGRGVTLIWFGQRCVARAKKKFLKECPFSKSLRKKCKIRAVLRRKTCEICENFEKNVYSAVFLSEKNPHNCDLLPQNERKVASLYKEIYCLLNMPQNNRNQRKINTKYTFLLDKAISYRA